MRQGDDRRVLRLPVPVLQPRRPHARQILGTTPTTSGSSSGTTRSPSTTTPPLAAEAAVAAERQGKFWEMHDKLFAQPAGDSTAPALEQTRSGAGLDMDSSGRARQPRRQGARRRRSGARPASSACGDADLLHRRPAGDGRAAVRGLQAGHRRRARARRQPAAAGRPARRLYATLLDRGHSRRCRRRAGPAAGAGTEVFRVAALDAPARGGDAAEGHPHRVRRLPVPVLQRGSSRPSTKLLKAYGPDLALVVSPQPAAVPPERRCRPRWPPRRRASRGSSGRCTTSCSPTARRSIAPSLDRYAAELGLDAARFKAGARRRGGQGSHHARQGRRRAASARAGRPSSSSMAVRSTARSRSRRSRDDRRGDPQGGRACWPPGRRAPTALRRAHQERARQEGRAARPARQARSRRRPPYPRRGRRRAGARPRRRADHHRRVGRLPVPVLRARRADDRERLRHDYPDKVRFVWRDMPLPFHAQARPAAIAARAAGAQGKFWAMHDRSTPTTCATRPRAVREGRRRAGPRHGKRSGPRSTPSRASRRSTPTPGGREGRRHGDAHLLHQRQDALAARSPTRPSRRGSTTS